MEMQINMQDIMNKLIQIQEDVNILKQNNIDEDCILDDDDREALRIADEEFKDGKTFSLEDIEMERRKNAWI